MLDGQESAGERGGPMADSHGVKEREETELVFSLCHEIGNLVGAVRLQAHLLDEDLGARELALASVELDDLGARCAALLTHMRPLLSAGDRTSVRIRPSQILESLSCLIEEHGGRGVKLVVEECPELPELELDPEVIRQLLVSFFYAAIEAAAPRGQVRVHAQRRAGGVAFVLEDDGEVGEDPRRWAEQMRRGRPLLCAVANRILEKRGGRLEVERDAKCTRIAFVLPTAEGSVAPAG